MLALLGAATAVPLYAAEDAGAIGHLKQLNVEDLLDIEVTSVSRHAAPLAQAPSAIQVITQAQIRRSGATTLAEALRLADNLQVAQRGARGWAITARGFNTDLANKLLVMIDGRTVYTPLYSGVFWEAQDYLLEDIDRIEVISGPGGTLWGANAVNGVINIITKQSTDTQGLHAEAGSGSELDAIAGLRYGGTLTPQVSYRVYGKYLDFDDSVLKDGSAANDSWRRKQAGFRMDGADTTLGPWTVQGDYYSNHEQVPTGGTTTMEGENLLGRWSHALANDSGLSLQLYYDRTYLSLAVPPLAPGGTVFAPAGTLHDELQTFDLDFQHRLWLSNTQPLPGAWASATRTMSWTTPRQSASCRKSWTSSSTAPSCKTRSGCWMTCRSPSARRWNTTATPATNSSPACACNGRPLPPRPSGRPCRAPSARRRASIGTCTKAPPPYPTILKGSEDFESEHVLAYELGYRAQAGSLFTTSLATFYNHYGDVRSTTITPVTFFPFFFQNAVAGHTWGAEWTGTLQLADNWSLHAGYVLLKEDLHVKPGYIDITNARNETADPQQQASLRSSLDLPGGFGLDAGLRWTDTAHNIDGITVGRVPAYLDLNARLSWRASAHLELAVTGENLLHDQHPEYGFPSATRTEIQRSVYGKLVWRQ